MKIVVRGANWIGDAVMTIPALQYLRGSFPDATISLHTRSWAEGVFRDVDLIDEIIPIKTDRSRIGSVLDQVRELKKHQFDRAILFPNSFESALVTRLAGIPKRLGYATEKRGLLLTDAIAVPLWKNERHESNYYLDLVRKIDGSGTPAETETLHLAVSEERRSHAAELLRSYGVDVSRPVLALGAGSTNSRAKRWPASNFARLAELAVDQLGAQIVLLGSADETDVSAEVAAISKITLVDLSGKTDLADATAVLSVVDLFVSNDMGLAHISAATGTPTIVIFGPTNDVTTRPLGQRVEIIREPVDCSPCMLRDCPIDHRCMTRVAPERVFESARKILETQ